MIDTLTQQSLDSDTNIKLDGTRVVLLNYTATFYDTTSIGFPKAGFFSDVCQSTYPYLLTVNILPSSEQY